MALRMVEIFVPAADSDDALRIIRELPIEAVWNLETGSGQMMIRLLVSSEHIEQLLGVIDRRFATADGYRVLLLLAAAIYLSSLW